MGSTTWKRVLGDLRGLKQGIFIHHVGLWKHLTEYKDEERSLRLKNYFKFLFVREPLHRFLSAFKDKFIGKRRKFSNNIRKAIVKRFRPQDYDPKGENNVSFSEFAQFFAEDVARHGNPHWRQYEQLCHPCVVNYDFIGHLETLQQDASLILKIAGIDDRVTFPPIHNTTNSHDLLHYYSQVPSEYITRLGQTYRNDYEMFGYEFLGPVKSLLNQTFLEGNKSSR